MKLSRMEEQSVYDLVFVALGMYLPRLAKKEGCLSEAELLMVWRAVWGLSCHTVPSRLAMGWVSWLDVGELSLWRDVGGEKVTLVVRVRS